MSEKKWRALDHCDNNNRNKKDVLQDADQLTSIEQESYEWIIVKDSEGVDIKTTDTQIAISLQAAIQAAIAIVIRITIGDNEEGNAVIQDMKQFSKTKQRNSQKTIIENSRNIEVTTTDTDIAVNIQLLLQILLALVATVDVG
ncbi:spore coat protein [Priestia megaterium]|uniref:spore coat protein n=1 Tax=Priestia megaterium TaxID=1404 RepID=UPI00203F7890|nr:spore coat protein [Priestia megaterium]MCM3197175.1 spore coat protein [Priestia megaterium]